LSFHSGQHQLFFTIIWWDRVIKHLNFCHLSDKEFWIFCSAASLSIQGHLKILCLQLTKKKKK
jgi:hypothetical protein